MFIHCSGDALCYHKNMQDCLLELSSEFASGQMLSVPMHVLTLNVAHICVPNSQRPHSVCWHCAAFTSCAAKQL